MTNRKKTRTSFEHFEVMIYWIVGGLFVLNMVAFLSNLR